MLKFLERSIVQKSQTGCGSELLFYYLNCIALNNYVALLYIIYFRPSDNLLIKRKLQTIKFGFIFIFSTIILIPISIQKPDNIRITNQISGIYAWYYLEECSKWYQEHLKRYQEHKMSSAMLFLIPHTKMFLLTAFY